MTAARARRTAVMTGTQGMSLSEALRVIQAHHPHWHVWQTPTVVWATRPISVEPLGSGTTVGRADTRTARPGPGRVGTQVRVAGMSGGWRDRGLCAEVDPELFFPDKGESTVPAKRVCFACEVRAQCLEYALATSQRFGVWGGLSYPQRRRHPQWQEAA